MSWVSSPNSPNNPPVPINGVEFDILADNDIIANSVSKISEVLAFGNQGGAAALFNGLYDPRMGPINRGDICVTCTQTSDNCPGHYGHIELSTDAYHPLLLKKLLKLLVRSCSSCHTFKMSGVLSKSYLEYFKRVYNIFTSMETMNNDNYKLYALLDPPMFRSNPSAKFVVEQDMAKVVSNNKESDSVGIHWVYGSREDSPNSIETNDSIVYDSSKHFSIASKLKDLVKMKLDASSDNDEFNTVSLDDSFNHKLTDFFESIFWASCPDKICANCQGKKQAQYRLDSNNKIFQKIYNNDLLSATYAHQSGSAEKFLFPREVRDILHQLWINEKEILSYLFPASIRNNESIFFLKNICVSPNRFRPLMSRGMGGGDDGGLLDDASGKFLPISSVLLRNIIEASLNIEKVISDSSESSNIAYAIVNLQEKVNTWMDSTLSNQVNMSGVGIRQALEKKEGLFRMKMMGKRVNYAARSVISPDVNLETDEIGITKYIAMNLSFPEQINKYNLSHMVTLIQNGNTQYPGANSIEFADGRVISLAHRNDQQRQVLAQSVCSVFTNRKNQKNGGIFDYNIGPPKTVHRHLRSGDYLLVNRQPTLHKPSILALKVKVLEHLKTNTIRMHYANCNSFNADFDGDEINLHCPQDLTSMAEAKHVANCQKQYISPTNAKPLRGLIQDHVIASTMLTMPGCFLSVENYTYLLNMAVLKFLNKPSYFQISNSLILPTPAVLFPQTLYTGPQLINGIFLNLKVVGLNHVSGVKIKPLKTRTNFSLNTYGNNLVIRDSEIICGVIDKTNLGAVANSFMHVIFEYCGGEVGGNCFSAMSVVFTTYLQQIRGFTCRLRDMLLSTDGNEERAILIENGNKSSNYTNILSRIDELKIDGNVFKIDKVEEAALSCNRTNWGSTIDAVLPKFISVPFPTNCFASMIDTGAKGSKINFSQISALLGQQELEGNRVPFLKTCRSLPHYLPGTYLLPRAGGYVTHRFLDGICPDEFFFHCMAGREGLVDTAVKTARSGYLQRCLMKHLEAFVIEYDGTCRDQSSGQIIQFIYGEDGVEPSKSSLLFDGRNTINNINQQQELKYILHNEEHANWFHTIANEKASFNEIKTALKNICKHYRVDHAHRKFLKNEIKKFYDSETGELKGEEENRIIKTEEKQQHNSKGNSFQRENPISSLFHPINFYGSMSDKMIKISNNDSYPNQAIKYQSALAPPGESVGTTAAQGMGEPSTQMTLNTFHLAGHGGANVTLGIPRLREIVQTASRSLSTPLATFEVMGHSWSECQEYVDDALLRKYGCQEDKQLQQDSLISNVWVGEKIEIISTHSRVKTFEIVLKLESHRFDESLFDLKFRTRIDLELRRILKKQHAIFKKQSTTSQTTTSKSPTKSNTIKQKEEKSIEEKSSSTEELKMEINDSLSDEDSSDEEEDVDDTHKRKREHIKQESKSRNIDSKEELEFSIFNTPQIETSPEMPIFDGIQLFFPSKGVFYSTEYYCLRSRYIDFSEIGSGQVDFKQIVLNEINNLQLNNTDSSFTLRRLNSDGQQNSIKIQMEGEVDFPYIFSIDRVDHTSIWTNDISKMLDIYGVEAARASIVKEISTVFGHYGIVVDYRHLYLIADYMTLQGGFRPFSRNGIAHCFGDEWSPFATASYETSMGFLNKASMSRSVDSLRNPSGAIVLGQVPRVGSGMGFELMADLASAISVSNGKRKIAQNEHKRFEED